MTATNNQCETADTASGHITPPDGNIFADLGFKGTEARAMLLSADVRIAEEAETSQLLTELFESAADLHEHGVVGRQDLRRLLGELEDADLRAKVLARLPEKARAVFVDIDDL